MALKNLEPFNGIQIITTEADERDVAHLLQQGKCVSLYCQDCGGQRFEVEATIPAKLEILSGDVIIISKAEYLSVKVNRVVKCAHCGCDDYVHVSDTTESKDDR